MLNMPVVRLRRIGNSLGLILPGDYVREKHLAPNEEVRVDVERVPSLREVLGSLRKYGLSVQEWNDLTNEGEDL